MESKLKDILSHILTNKCVIVSGDRQTGKTTLAVNLIENVHYIASALKILYVSFNRNMTTSFISRLPAHTAKRIDVTNYEHPNNISNSVQGKEYDLIVVDAYEEPTPNDIEIILKTAKKEHSRVVFFIDTGTVRSTRIGPYPTIMLHGEL